MRSCTHDAFDLLDLFCQFLVTDNAFLRVLMQDGDVRLSAEQSVLDILSLPLADGESHNKRGNARPNTENRDQGDQGNDRLLALCPQVAHGDKEFKFHAGVTPASCAGIESR